MNCPSCLQELVGQPARCPFCQASLQQGRVASVAPPRARDRETAADLSYRATTLGQEMRHLLDILLTWLGRLIPAPLRRIPHPELWLSVLWPGLGHLSLGWYRLGFLIMGTFLGMLYMLVTLALDRFQPDTTMHLFWTGLLLGLVHSHAVQAANQKYPGRPVWPPWVLNVAVLLLLFGQLHLLGRLIYGAGYRREVRGIRLQAYGDWFKPHFQGGDLLDVNPVAPGDLERGDFVMIDAHTIDRVLGLEGDELTLQPDAILRNGAPLTGAQKPLVAYEPTLDIPDQVAHTPPARPGQTVQVPPGEAGLLYWGRRLRTIPIASLPGRIDGILHPPERACRFVRGIRQAR